MASLRLKLKKLVFIAGDHFYFWHIWDLRVGLWIWCRTNFEGDVLGEVLGGLSEVFEAKFWAKFWAKFRAKFWAKFW